MKKALLVMTALCLNTLAFANPTMEEFLSGKKSNNSDDNSRQIGLFQDCKQTLTGYDCGQNEHETPDYLKGPYERYLDDLYECQSSAYGCSEEEQAAIDHHEISQRGISAKEFSDLMFKFDPNLESKGYFIPLSLSNRELIAFAAATSLGLVIFQRDQEIMNFIQDHKSEKTAKLATVGNMFGADIIPPVAIGSYFLGAVLDNGKLKQLGLFTVTAGLATQAITEGFKKSFQRVRPNGDMGPYAFGQEGNNSFFSGHSSGAWSFATVIAEVYKEDHAWVPFVSYGLAAVTSYARMHDRKHWMTDVLAGAIVAHLVTKAVIRLHKNDGSEGGFLVYPSYDPVTGIGSINVHYTPKQPKTKLRCASLPDGPFKIRACIQEAFENSK